MLHYILLTLFITRVLADKTCLNINDFNTTVNLEDIPDGQWIFLSNVGQDACMKITINQSTEQDIQEVEDRCKGITMTTSAKFDYSKVVKTVTFSVDKLGKTLISRQDGQLYFLAGLCRDTIKMEFRRFRNTLGWFVVPFFDFFFAIAFRVAPEESERCYEQLRDRTSFCD